MSHPPSATIPKDVAEVPLLISGQGVFLFEYINNDQNVCLFSITNHQHSDGLIIEWATDGVTVVRINSSVHYTDPKNSKGLLNKNGAFYWFSLDAQHQTFYAGIGEARQETKIYQYTMPYATDDERKSNKAFLESLTKVGYFQNVTPLRLLRNPVIQNIPFHIKDAISLDAIAKGLYLCKSHLSSVSQQMYDCVVDTILDTDDFPDFSKAVQQSIADGWCKRRLIEKSNEFSKLGPPNLKETYLRITLGTNNGNSPGIPYVMEIWPVGHYSPIHNHGGADAVIRVLHGEIDVNLFPFLSDKVGSFASHTFNKEDITWISPTLNQVHQLSNLGKETCVTIQSYMYDSEDNAHYDYFDYLDENSKKQQYEPDSDMDFLDFKNQMKKEWKARPLSFFEICTEFCWQMYGQPEL